MPRKLETRGQVPETQSHSLATKVMLPKDLTLASQRCILTTDKTLVNSCSVTADGAEYATNTELKNSNTLLSI